MVHASVITVEGAYNYIVRNPRLLQILHARVASHFSDTNSTVHQSKTTDQSQLQNSLNFITWNVQGIHRKSHAISALAL